MASPFFKNINISKRMMYKSNVLSIHINKE